MKNLLLFVMGLLALRPGNAIATEKQQTPDGKPLLDVVVRTLNGKQALNRYDTYKGKVALTPMRSMVSSGFSHPLCHLYLFDPDHVARAAAVAS